MFNVILPTYNEAESIIPMIQMLDEVFNNMNALYRIIVVDDNSPDNTSGIVKSLYNKSVLVIDRPKKQGLGNAYRAGIQHCTYPYTVILDSDLQHDPFYIPKMYKQMTEDCDIVSGTRYQEGGKVCGWSFKRRLTSCGANTLAKFMLYLNSSDLTGSFRLYKTSVLKNLLPMIKSKGFGFQMEVIAMAEFLGYKIKEQPIIFYDRSAGESKIATKEFIWFLLVVARLFVKKITTSLSIL